METELQESSSNDVSFWTKLVEQQREERFDFRTTGSLFPLGDEGLNPVSNPVQIWTVDVSTTGVLVRTYAELEHNCSRVLVQLVMPQLNESLIEGTVIRCTQEVAKYMNGKERESYLYGLQFTRLVKKEEVTEELLNAPTVSVECETSENESDPHTQITHFLNSAGKIRRGAEKSQLPLLSAIALVVVYAVLLFVF